MALSIPFMVACGAPEGSTPTYERIFLVTLDTLRADRLGAYGYPRETSPFIDGLAGRGVVFERAYSATSTTSPSHATIFSGLYPLQHGVERNGQALPRGVESLAERMRRAGFLTAAFVGTRVHFTPGRMNRGFDYFDRPTPKEAKPYRSADATLVAARRWIESCGGCDRLFLWIHLFDVHDPHRSPAEHLEALKVDGGAALRELKAPYVDEHAVLLAFYDDEAASLVETMSAYDAEIRFADAELGRFYAFVLDALPRPTLWILTADHGEGLGNHGFAGHGKYIYEEQVNVPLIFHASDGSLGPARVGAVVEHVDLLPTIAQLAGDRSPLPAQPSSPR